MDKIEVVLAVISAILGSAGTTALINALHDRWKFKATRKVAMEDRAEKKADITEELSETVEEFKVEEEKKNKEIDAKLISIEKQSFAQSEALKLILLDRILNLGESYVQKGEISFDERKRFHAMHDSYHQGLGGNGDADLIVKAVDELQLKH